MVVVAEAAVAIAVGYLLLFAEVSNNQMIRTNNQTNTKGHFTVIVRPSYMKKSCLGLKAHPANPVRATLGDPIFKTGRVYMRHQTLARLEG